LTGYGRIVDGPWHKTCCGVSRADIRLRIEREGRLLRMTARKRLSRHRVAALTVSCWRSQSTLSRAISTRPASCATLDPVIKTPGTTLIEHVLASIPAAFFSGRGPPDGDDVPNATGQAISEGSTV
jgi:hypothetical protein